MSTAQDIYNKALLRQKPIYESASRGDSEIQQFYKDSVIFVTGASGFLGKQLVEKLLRSCDVRKIYIMIRSKKNITPEKRLGDLLKDGVYDDLRNIKPNFEDKIKPIDGDIKYLELGIKEEDRRLLMEEVEIIFHIAALVKFDAPVSQAILSNVRGTREVLKLASACKKLRSFVHVSTAYSNANKRRCYQDVYESFYKSPLPPDAMIQLAEEVDESLLESIEDKLMQDWPNSYTFTKTMTEELVSRTTGLPICVVRPSSVICSYTEPYPGWIDKTTIHGATGITHDVTTGVMHVFKANNNARIDYVPVDFVNNATIASAWETAMRYNEGKTDIKIYNLCVGKHKRTWGELTNTQFIEALPYMSPTAFWYQFCFNVQNQWLYYLIIALYHFVPAYFVDVCSNFRGRNSGLVKRYKKMFKLNKIMLYFGINQWNFEVSNTEALYRKMSACDQKIFHFDMSTIDWREFMLLWVIGIRKFIIEDGLEISKGYLRRQLIQKYLTYIITCVYGFVFVQICYFLYRMIN